MGNLWVILFAWPAGIVVGNLIAQGIVWLLLGPSVYWRFTCKAKPWCWRVAWHRVDGTTYRTCHVHLTPGHCDRLFEKHAEKRPDAHARLNNGG